MDVVNKTIWQVAAGDTNRFYADTLLRWDAVAVGPGRYGPWPECQEALREAGRTEKKIGDIRRLYDEMRQGDIVVLRAGTRDVHGVGVVATDSAEWNEEFGDVDGWDLEHVRRVKWIWEPDPEPKSFPTYSLKLGLTIQELSKGPVVEWLEHIDTCPGVSPEDLRDLPEPTRGLGDSVEARQEIADYLFDQGVSVHSIDSLLGQMEDLVRIAGWYSRSENGPSEHETVAYLVVPMLRALGWTPQKMAVEWRNVDLALFGSAARDEGDLSVVVEAKKLGRSCWTARSQAERYALSEGREACRRLLVTDGLRYAVYVREISASGFPDTPQAYLNLTRMRRSYPLLGECGGAKEALLLLSADWVPRAG